MYLRVTRGRFDPARFDEVMAVVPAIMAGLRQLPGCRDARAGFDRAAGTTLSVSTFDTLANAQFSRDAIGGGLGEALARLRDTGAQLEPPEFYEVVG